MTWQNLLTPFVWLLNGLLVVLYSLVLHWQAALLAPVLAWLCLTAVPKNTAPGRLGLRSPPCSAPSWPLSLCRCFCW